MAAKKKGLGRGLDLLIRKEIIQNRVKLKKKANL